MSVASFVSFSFALLPSDVTSVVSKDAEEEEGEREGGGGGEEREGEGREREEREREERGEERREESSKGRDFSKRSANVSKFPSKTLIRRGEGGSPAREGDERVGEERSAAAS